MENMGVISKVTEPTAWCSGMVVVPKPLKDKLRICVDLTPLNVAVKRECHILPAVNQTFAMMSEAKVFTKLDARSEIPITPESQPSLPLSGDTSSTASPFASLQLPNLFKDGCCRYSRVWVEPQQRAFQKLKEELSSPKALVQYSKETKVAADASAYGIGAVLTPKQTGDSWQHIMYISRVLVTHKQTARRMCCSDCQEPLEKRHRPHQSTTGVQSHTTGT